MGRNEPEIYDCECGGYYWSLAPRKWGCDECSRLYPAGASRAEILHALTGRGLLDVASLVALTGLNQYLVAKSVERMHRDGMLVRRPNPGADPHLRKSYLYSLARRSR